MVELSPSEGEAATLFLALRTQWRWHPVAGVRLGLIYEAVAPTAANLSIEMSPRLFCDVRVMETAAMDALADDR